MSQMPVSLLVAGVAALCCGYVEAAEPATSKQAASSDALVVYTEARDPCTERSATRNAYFGDLHIHTGFSYDVRPFGSTTTPADAYRFARGGSIGVPPFDDSGRETATLQLRTPLDFAAVTDHAEFFGELGLCLDPSSSVYDVPACQHLRGSGGELSPGSGNLFRVFVNSLLTDSPYQVEEICGEDPAACVESASPLWKATQQMAEDAYDRSSRCEFTSFVGYEHTGTPNSNNYHRNVIFRNADVPARAISYIDAPRGLDLWNALTDECLNAVDGCDVLVIPHNSNLSSGSMFPSYAAGSESAEFTPAAARLQVAMEPIMEIFQHKGNSECFNGFPGILGAPDELCEFEQVRSVGERRLIFGETYELRFCEEGEIGRRGFAAVGCVSRNDFFRSVLLTGLQDEAAIGVNPYKLGAIGSTDTHLALAGATGESDWPGHLVPETELDARLRSGLFSPQSLVSNPGGLAGIWAVENSRDALFEAMRRREVFGTSGTRIQPRLFAGWDLDENACRLANLPEYGYAHGVPMGSDLPPGTAPGRLRLLASAVRDPDGAALQKLQIIKGWIDPSGQARYEVIDVAGADSPDGQINLLTGQWSGQGSSSLCAVFEDTAFDPAESTYYYLRVVEVPTLRWNWAQCVALPPDERPAACQNDAPRSIQEMAWTSPIWYAPPPARD